MFACEASTKIVSLCAVGDFRNKTGALSYRFGQYGKAPELVVASTPHSVARRFRYHEDLWAKGMAPRSASKAGRSITMSGMRKGRSGSTVDRTGRA